MQLSESQTHLLLVLVRRGRLVELDTIVAEVQVPIVELRGRPVVPSVRVPLREVQRYHRWGS